MTSNEIKIPTIIPNSTSMLEIALKAEKSIHTQWELLQTHGEWFQGVGINDFNVAVGRYLEGCS